MSAFDRLRPAGWSRREARIAGGLGVLCLALLGVVTVEAVLPRAEPDDAPEAGNAAPSRTGAASPAIALPPLAAMSEVLARPVFSPGRRPAGDAEDALGQADALLLQGIVVSASDKVALIRHGQPLKTERLKEGQSVEGWIVTSIARDRVTIENAGTAHELRLKRKSPQDGGGQIGG